MKVRVIAWSRSSGVDWIRNIYEHPMTIVKEDRFSPSICQSIVESARALREADGVVKVTLEFV